MANIGLYIGLGDISVNHYYQQCGVQLMFVVQWDERSVSPAGQSALTAERAAALRSSRQTDSSAVSVPTRAPPAQHHRPITRRLHRTTAGAQREQQAPQS